MRTWGVENVSVEQLAFADKIILNKRDLPLTEQLKTEQGVLEPDFLPSNGSEHVHDEGVSSVSWYSPGLQLIVVKLQTWISSPSCSFMNQALPRLGLLRHWKDVNQRITETRRKFHSTRTAYARRRKSLQLRWKCFTFFPPFFVRSCTTTSSALACLRIRSSVFGRT